MKFNCGETITERHERLEKWHRWFAWRPVRLGSRDCRWLEYIERKGNYVHCWQDAWWIWEYRAIVK